MSVRFGLLGIGRFGINYLRTLQQFDDVEVSWICATRESSLKQALPAVPAATVRRTIRYQEVFADPYTDAVAIATPASTHYTLSKAALEAGKHVIVEKPAAFHASEVEELVALARSQNRVWMAGHIHLYNPPIQKLKQDLDQGVLGDIQHIQSIGTNTGLMREDMSALWDLFPHDVSIALYLTGQFPLTVQASGARYLQQKFEDLGTMQLTFPNNVTLTSFASWMHSHRQRRVVVLGSKGTAVFDDYAEHKLVYYRANAEEKISYARDLPLTLELRHFLDSIAQNKQPRTGGDEALQVTRVLEAMQQSIDRHGKQVQL